MTKQYNHKDFPMWTDAELSLFPLRGKTVAVLGYGNQGRPQALNLRDSGIATVVGTRDAAGVAAHRAREEGFSVMPFAAAVRQADVCMLLLPDNAIGPVVQELGDLLPGKACGVAHGLSLVAGWARFPTETDVFLVAPKAQGQGVRDRYVEGRGVPALLAVHHDASGNCLAVAQAYAKAIGCGRAGVFPTTAREETECDLFSEQAVLCGGLTALIKAAFEVLVEAGYNPQVAAFECLYEVKLLADLLQARGITGMRQAISPAAAFGDVTRGPRIIDERVKASMREVLGEIRSGQFAQELAEDAALGHPRLLAGIEADRRHTLETTYRDSFA